MLDERRDKALDEIETYVSQALGQTLENKYRLPRVHDSDCELLVQQLEAVARLLALLPTSSYEMIAHAEETPKPTTTRKRK